MWNHFTDLIENSVKWQDCLYFLQQANQKLCEIKAIYVFMLKQFGLTENFCQITALFLLT